METTTAVREDVSARAERPRFDGTSDEAVCPDVPGLLTSIVARLDRIEASLANPLPVSSHLTAKQAAAYLRISYSTFRKKATKIRRQPGTGRYQVEDLNEFAASLRPKRKR